MEACQTVIHILSVAGHAITTHLNNDVPVMIVAQITHPCRAVVHNNTLSLTAENPIVSGPMIALITPRVQSLVDARGIGLIRQVACLRNFRTLVDSMPTCT